MNEGRKKVVILQHRLLHYRIGLFETLRRRCQDVGIDLSLVHGQPTAMELNKRDVGELEWAERVRNRYVNIRGRDVLWQPFPQKHRDANLIVLMQENRLLSNYPILLDRLWSPLKVAYWGHGVNFQSDAPGGLRERWKRLMLNRVDWWFAYTEVTRSIVSDAGFPDERISVLNNAIDNGAFRSDLNAVSEADVNAIRQDLAIPREAPVGLFCGSLYPDKRIDFMVAAATRLRALVPDFHMVVIGDGPSMPQLAELSTGKPWMHLVGAQRGRDKARYFKLASVVLNPGLVGLHVLDSFCAGLPMFTTNNARHSPEIAYLENGRNGFVLDDDVETYAKAVARMLGDPQKLGEVGRNVLAAAEKYSLDSMVDNFVDGLNRCLALPKY